MVCMSNVSLSLHSDDPDARRAFAMHARTWQANRYVYPVVSRRSKGISIGVNLNPDKVCNFDCIYCSVDRTARRRYRWSGMWIWWCWVRSCVAMLDLVLSGEIYRFDPFEQDSSAALAAGERCGVFRR